MFTRLEKVPAFELMSVGIGRVTDEHEHDDPTGAKVKKDEQKQLWRKYRLSIDDFECEILEVFPDRDMFVGGESWLDHRRWGSKQASLQATTRLLQVEANWILFLGLLLFALEVSLVFSGRYTTLWSWRTSFFA